MDQFVFLNETYNKTKKKLPTNMMIKHTHTFCVTKIFSVQLHFLSQLATSVYSIGRRKTIDVRKKQ